ncbi:O-antigen polysaccharide polymerase Wzy [Idiomarina baltica]|uniref:Oligosaccharide repeat unit polymerase n=1 Tax=Idiomarina baltica OS145 TaxID=314276 RepID=A0ABP2CQ37_9GAMM|nr:O-antigen polysaccharide polymerase Wzy [Idiomarina baltica]EAQ31903.1 hypothetical protein OS145_11451 [Idiomarina baltica OS145]
MISIPVYIALATAFSIFYSISNLDLDKATALLIILVAFFCSLSYFKSLLFKKNSKGVIINASFIFLLSYFIVHFQFAIDYLIGFKDLSNLRLWTSPQIALKALILSIIGLLSFLIGFKIIKPRTYNQEKKLSQVDTRLLLIGFAIFFILYFFTVDRSYLAGNYGSVRLSSGAAYSVLLLKCFAFAFLIQTTRNDIKIGETYRSFFRFFISKGWIFNGIAFLYLLSVIVSGDRGPIIYWLAAYYANYMFVAENKSAKVFESLALILVGVTVIWGLGHVRSVGGELSFIEKVKASVSTESRFESKSIVPITQDLASSIRTVTMAIDAVPNEYDYFLGRLQFQQAISIIPFVSSFDSVIFDDNSYQYGGSSRFLTWLEQGDNRYSGVGSSAVADFYLDFGLLGVVVGLFVIGSIMRKVDFVLNSNSPPSYFWHVTAVCLFSVAIYIPRSTFLIEFKLVVWVFVILILNRTLIKSLR